MMDSAEGRASARSVLSRASARTIRESAVQGVQSRHGQFDADGSGGALNWTNTGWVQLHPLLRYTKPYQRLSQISCSETNQQLIYRLHPSHAVAPESFFSRAAANFSRRSSSVSAFSTRAFGPGLNTPVPARPSPLSTLRCVVRRNLGPADPWPLPRVLDAGADDPSTTPPLGTVYCTPAPARVA